MKKQLSIVLTVLVFSNILYFNSNLLFHLQTISGFGNESFLECPATIVTAYYRMKSKHSVEEYNSWMSNMLSLQDCMVIFTAPDTVEQIQSHRDPGLYPQTIIIPIELNQTFAYQLLTEEEWKHQAMILTLKQCNESLWTMDIVTYLLGGLCSFK